jgi:Flp pilus assembly protein TadD
MIKEWKRWLSLSGLILPLAIAGCSGSTQLALERPAEPSIYGSLPAEKPLDLGKKHYRNGEFGLAEQAFRKAIEEDKNDVEAWLGLAASYDRLRRFDQANNAYEVIVKLVGYTPTVLNNIGYHYILRGDRNKARETLAAAYRSDPQNPTIRNNLELLGAGPDGQPKSGG